MDPITVEFNAAISAVKHRSDRGCVRCPGNTPAACVFGLLFPGSVLSVQADLQYDQVYEVIIPQGATGFGGGPVHPEPAGLSGVSRPCRRLRRWRITARRSRRARRSRSFFDRPVELLDGSSARANQLRNRARAVRFGRGHGQWACADPHACRIGYGSTADVAACPPVWCARRIAPQ